MIGVGVGIGISVGGGGAGASLRASASRFYTSAAANALIADLVDPYGSGSTFSVVGSPPGQLSLSSGQIRRGATNPLLDTDYTIVIRAAKNQRAVEEPLVFRAVAEPVPLAPTVATFSTAENADETFVSARVLVDGVALNPSLYTVVYSDLNDLGQFDPQIADANSCFVLETDGELRPIAGNLANAGGGVKTPRVIVTRLDDNDDAVVDISITITNVADVVVGNESSPSPQIRDRTIAIYGDSIMLQETQAERFNQLLPRALMGRVQYSPRWQRARGGDTVLTIYRELLANVATDYANIVSVMWGANGYANSSQNGSDPFYETGESAQDWIDRFLEIVQLVTVTHSRKLAFHMTLPHETDPKVSRDGFRTFLRTYSNANVRVILHDDFVLANDTNDGVHPNYAGSVKVTNNFMRYIGDWIDPNPYPLATENSEAGNYVSNALMTGTSGTKTSGASGQVADGWNLAGTNIVGAKTTLAGRTAQRIAATNGGTAELTIPVTLNGLAGDVFEVAMLVRRWSPNREISRVMVDEGNAWSKSIPSSIQGSTGLDSETRVLRTVKKVAADPFTNDTVKLVANFRSGTSAGWVEVTQVTVTKVSAASPASKPGPLINTKGDIITLPGIADGSTPILIANPTSLTEPDLVGPTFTSSATQSVAEGAIFSLTITTSEAATFTKLSGNDAAQFTLSGSTLSMAAKDFETPVDGGSNNTYIVTIEATDAVGNRSQQVITVTVTNVDEGAPDTTAPTITSASSANVAENETLSHSLTANEAVAWSIRTTAQNGASLDADRFELSGNTLRWLSNGTKDFEAPNDSNTNNAYVVVVRATDAASNTTDQTVTINVTDVAEGGDTTAPTITSSNSVSVAENAQLAHTLTANETVTWTIRTAGQNGASVDAAQFELSGSTLRWLSNGTKDFETPTDGGAGNTYVVVVRATDSANNTTDQTITATVTDVSEGGVAGSGWNSSITASGVTYPQTDEFRSTATNVRSTRSQVGHASGKRVAILQATNGGTSALGVGDDGAAASNNAAVAGTNGTDRIVLLGSSITATGGTITGQSNVDDGVALVVAVDIDNDKVWFRKLNSTNWMPGLVTDEDVNTSFGGASISGLAGSVYLIGSLKANGDYTATIHTTADELAALDNTLLSDLPNFSAWE